MKKLASNTDEKRSKLSITTAKRISKKPRVHKRKGNKSETSSLKKGQSNSSFFNESESLLNFSTLATSTGEEIESSPYK